MGRPSVHFDSAMDGMKTSISSATVEDMAKIVQHSKAKGMGGRVHNNALSNSHLFLLQMGLLPVDRGISYPIHAFGQGAQEALDAYSTIEARIEEGYEILEWSYVSTLKKMLMAHEDYQELDEGSITLEMIAEEKEYFTSLFFDAEEAKKKWGKGAPAALKAFPQILGQIEQGKQFFDKEEVTYIKVLQDMLKDKFPGEKITLEMIAAESEYFEEMEEKEIGYIEAQFIPALLQILESGRK